MARRLSVVLVLFAMLALPAVAEAASKTVKVPVPGQGNLSIAQYRVKMGEREAPKAKVANASRLGDTNVIVSVSKRTGRRYDVTVFAMNPSGGASAAGVPNASIKISGVGRLRVSEIMTVADVLDAELGDFLQAARFCLSRAARLELRESLIAAGIPKRQAKRIIRALRRYLCQQGTLEQRIAAARTLEDEMGLAAPECFGTADEFQASLAELVILLTCIAPSEAIILYAQQGNHGTNCLGPPGSACAAGPACRPLPPEAVCFFFSGGVPLGVVVQLNARWAGNVMTDTVGPVIYGGYLPQGATSLSQERRTWLLPAL
jgi:hypothetical protein